MSFSLDCAVQVAPRKSRQAMVASLLAISLALPVWAYAQTPNTSYEPDVGQEGKDVIWVPTPQTMVEKMLDIAQVTPQDTLLDLGSGDGRTVITAAKRGLKAEGIEYNPDMAELARRNAAKEGVSDRATFSTADLFESDLSKASVITMFLLPTINETLRPKILELKPGTRIVSNSFRMGDWQPDQTAVVTDNCTNYCTALLWVVPAKVAGNWRSGDQQLVLSQAFQALEGKLDGTPISDAKLVGDSISFSVGQARYEGKINGNTITGHVIQGKRAPQERWQATRA